jgi:KDO2-lipid IV(A) lauroyltransferase
MDKERKKQARRDLGRILIKISVGLVKVLPLRLISFMGRAFGLMGYTFASRHRKITFDNLNIAFSKEKSKDQIKDIGRKSWQYMGEAGWELFYFLNNLSQVNERVSIVGLDNLKRALAKKRGVVALTGHFGNFPLLCLRLKEEGFVVSTMARPMRDEKAGDLFHKLRTEVGVKTIFSYPRRQAVFGSLKALDNNEIIVLQMDQNFGTGGVWVNFFGKLAATPVGPIILASRAKAAIVPMFITREGRGRYTLFIEEEACLEQRDEKDEAVLINVIKFTKIMEDWIRRYPQLWAWFHRRWKSRPTQREFDVKYKVEKVSVQKS